MNRKKNALALFEVISKSKEKRPKDDLNVPGWMQPPVGEAPQAAVPPAAEPSAAPAPAAEPAMRRMFVKAAIGESTVSTTGGRLKLSLNYAASMGIAVALVLALAGMFALGRMSAGAAQSQRPPVNTEASGNETDESQASAGGETVKANGEKETAATAPAPVERIKGKFYLVIQQVGDATSENWSDADKIVKYCEQNGEKATVAKITDSHGRQKYIVWSLVPFDSPGQEKAREHAKIIESMGKRYFAEHGKYRLGQASRGEYWFLQYK